jgi:hypothetical protein
VAGNGVASKKPTRRSGTHPLLSHLQMDFFTRFTGKFRKDKTNQRREDRKHAKMRVETIINKVIPPALLPNRYILDLIYE